MAVTNEDLRDFLFFAGEKLVNGGADSLVELARQWESQRPAKKPVAETVGIPIEIDPATLKFLAEAFPEVSDELLLKRALNRRGGVTTEQLLSKAASAAAKAAQE